jgi:ABC-type Fe3+/spermidine/putrescine transport system ATPase subunit
MNLLNVSGIYKKDERGFELKDISFSQQRFQNMAIAGETGSGKTTLLKIIAGLAQQDAGEVWFDGEKVLGPNYKLIPGHPGIAFLSQYFELPIHLRVEQALEYANELTQKNADIIYDVCQITHLMKRRTNQLSGGEKQRIALARLLTTSPRLLLLDEPFSNTDMIHKNTLKQVIRAIGDQLKISCIMVSHDPLDTLSWADAIMVMKDGIIVQEDTPDRLYYRPATEYVAGLFGKYNTIRGIDGFIRPSQLKIVPQQPGALPGTVNDVLFFGTHYEIEVQLSQNTVVVQTDHGDYTEGETVFVVIKS